MTTLNLVQKINFCNLAVRYSLMKARYNRISTPNQKLERQLIKQHTDEVLYNDVVSGSTSFEMREYGVKLINDINKGVVDYVSVSSIDRLGRNMFNIIDTLKFFDEKKVTLRVDNLGLESRINGKVNPTFNLITSVMANVAQMEREALLERQREGIAIAKAKGIYKGRVRGTIESDDIILSKYKNVIKRLRDKQSLRDTAKLCNVSLGTVQKVKRVMKRNLKTYQVLIANDGIAGTGKIEAFNLTDAKKEMQQLYDDFEHVDIKLE